MSYIRVVFYHDIALSAQEERAPKCYGPTVEQFRDQMEFLKSNWNVLSIEEVAHCCKSGKFPKQPSVAITFDDGLSGVMLAAEMLLDLKLPANVFLATRFIDTYELPWFIHLDDILLEAQRRGCALSVSGREFRFSSKHQQMGFRRYAKDLLLQQGYAQQMKTLWEWAEAIGVELGQNRKNERTFLTWKQIEELANNGICFGSHTHSHVDLRVLDDTELEEEFARPAKIIEEKIGKEHIKFVSYPDGRFDQRVIGVAQKYHAAAFAAIGSSSWKDVFCMPRRCVSRGDVDKLKYTLSWRRLLEWHLKHYIKLVLRMDYDGM